MQITAELGIVKSLSVCKSRQLLFTATDKSIFSYDLRSGEQVSEFRGHSDIKCIETTDNFLFAGSKGMPSQGALLIFDLRKSTLAPCEEKEKNADVFSIAAS
jgi:WD40 repeat protein